MLHFFPDRDFQGIQAGLYGDVIEEGLDWAVGETFDFTPPSNCAIVRNTLEFWFLLSDNGPWISRAGSGRDRSGLFRAAWQRQHVEGWTRRAFLDCLGG